MRKLIKLSALIVTVFSLPLAADTIKVDMAPGLWENSFKLTGDSGKKMQEMQSEQMKKAMDEMKKQMANMPAEQRKQMEAMMTQAGVKLDGDSLSLNNEAVKISNDGAVTKQCITQAEIVRGDWAEDNEDENCKSTLSQISKGRFKSTQVCTGEDPSRMEAEINFDSPKHYSGKGTMSQTVQGKEHTIDIVMEGTWVSSNCGSIKPEKE